MLALRVSATDIDALRRYRGDEDADLADLLTQLRRESAPSPAMLAGTAMHKALEESEPGEHGELKADGYTFEIRVDGEIDIPEIREMKATEDYQIGDVLVTLVGKVDAVRGKRVDDHKFTGRYDPERFLNSYQWRVYLEIFGADEFRWNVFEGREIGDQHYAINAFHQLTMHRYPGMGDDIRREISGFVEFAKTHLPEKIGRAA
jgi:hypothetical protein